MFTKPTVLVLGAGASAAYGFPTGETLKERIIRDHDTQIESWVNQIAGQESGMPLLTEFIQGFMEFRAKSIDAYLEHLDAKQAKLGKLLIAAYLLDYENASKQKVPKGSLLDLEGSVRTLWYSECDWMMKIFELMDSGANRETFKDNELTVVTFNYDRLFEFALYLHVKHRFGLQDNAATKIVQAMPIHHVYGHLGGLKILGYPNGLEYRPGPLHENVFIDTAKYAANNIRIVHEMNKEEDPILCKAQAAIAEAQRVVFLGFRFGELNVKRLVQEGRRDWSTWLASAMCLKEQEKLVVERSIPPKAKNDHRERIKFGEESHDALEFLRENIATLTD